MESFKSRLMIRLGMVVVIAGSLWALWAFGLEDSLTAGMGSGAAHALEVFVAVGITLLALIWPASALLGDLASSHERLESELGPTMRRYRNIVESTHDIILEINQDRQIVFANPAVKLLGYDRDQLLNRPVESLLHPSVREEALPRITTMRIGPRATLNYPVLLLTDENSMLSEQVPSMELIVDATGLWKESDEIVRTKGTEKTFLGTLFVARVRMTF
jgi:PAS domain-containing protein